MKTFINISGHFCSNRELLEELNISTNEILSFVCYDSKEDFIHYCSGLADRESLEMAMTYVYGKHLKEIHDHFGYQIDLYNFLNKTVIDE